MSSPQKSLDMVSKLHNIRVCIFEAEKFLSEGYNDEIILGGKNFKNVVKCIAYFKKEYDEIMD